MARLRQAGWTIDEDTGAKVFRCIVEYTEESDLPDFPISVVWKATPVRIVLADGASVSKDGDCNNT